MPKTRKEHNFARIVPWAAVGIAAMDEGGGQAVVGPAPLVFTAKRKPKGNETLTYNTTLTLRKKTTSLAIAVYDKNGDKTLTRVLVKGD